MAKEHEALQVATHASEQHVVCIQERVVEAFDLLRRRLERVQSVRLRWDSRRKSKGDPAHHVRTDLVEVGYVAQQRVEVEEPTALFERQSDGAPETDVADVGPSDLTETELIRRFIRNDAVDQCWAHLEQDVISTEVRLRVRS